MATIGSATGNLALHHVELLGKSALQAGRIKTSESGHLAGLQSTGKQSHKTSKVGRVEDDYHVLAVGAIALDVLAKAACNLAVALEQVLASHTSLAWSTTA